MVDPIASQSPTETRTAGDKTRCTYFLTIKCVLQDYVDALKQKVVKLEAMAARNSNDKGITAQVCLLCNPLWLQNSRRY
jgi:hypothetical protein